MTRVMCVGDIHLSDTPPSLRTDSYADDILAKLSEAGQLALAHDCEAIVLAGDVFHIKTASRTSHRLVQRTGDVLREAGLRVLIVPGNHDLSNDRLESLNKQPLGVLGKMDGIEILMGGDHTLPIFGLPYLHSWMEELPRWMSRYTAWADKNKGEDFDFWPLMVTHAPIFPDNENPPYEHIAASDWTRLMQEKGDCYYGHIHDPHGDYKPGTNTIMCNNGAISRGSLHEATLKREPKVTLWDNGTFTALPISYRPVDSVFRIAEKEDVDEKVDRVEEFLENIGSTVLESLSIEEVAHHAKTRGLNPRTLNLINELLESAS